MKYNIKVSKLEDGSYKLKINNYSRYEVEEVEALEIKYLQTQLQQKENIIKEVREYIEEKYDYILGDDTFLDHDERIERKQIKHILDILKGSDKE